MFAPAAEMMLLGRPKGQTFLGSQMIVNTFSTASCIRGIATKFLVRPCVTQVTGRGTRRARPSFYSTAAGKRTAPLSPHPFLRLWDERDERGRTGRRTETNGRRTGRDERRRTGQSESAETNGTVRIRDERRRTGRRRTEDERRRTRRTETNGTVRISRFIKSSNSQDRSVPLENKAGQQARS
jgi:hypothetical protein